MRTLWFQFGAAGKNMFTVDSDSIVVSAACSAGSAVLTADPNFIVANYTTPAGTTLAAELVVPIGTSVQALGIPIQKDVPYYIAYLNGINTGSVVLFLDEDKSNGL